MTRKLSIILTVAALCAIFCFAGLAESEDGPTAKQIGSDMKKYLGQDLSFRDELGYIYKKSKWEGYLRFDTQYVSCRISLEKKDDIDLLKEMVRAEVEPTWAFISGMSMTPGDNKKEFVFDVSSIERPKYPRDGMKKGEKDPIGE